MGEFVGFVLKAHDGQMVNVHWTHQFSTVEMAE
jgi:hypothetical protein